MAKYMPKRRKRKRESDYCEAPIGLSMISGKKAVLIKKLEHESRRSLIKAMRKAKREGISI